MGVTSELEMRFPKERPARWAMHIAQDLLKLAYAPEDLPWAKESYACPSLSASYFAFREQAASYDLDPRGTALEWLRRYRTAIFIDRCQDIARWDSMDDPEALFPQLCFTYALRYPHVPFSALYRHEMTVSGAILLLRVRYDGAVLHAQEKTGMRPMDEDDWSGVAISDYIAENGVFVKKSQSDR